MKAKLLRDVGEIAEGTEVEIVARSGTNDDRSDEDVGGRSEKVAPVYEVTDTERHGEEVDTRDLKPLQKPGIRELLRKLQVSRGCGPVGRGVGAHPERGGALAALTH